MFFMIKFFFQKSNRAAKALQARLPLVLSRKVTTRKTIPRGKYFSKENLFLNNGYNKSTTANKRKCTCCCSLPKSTTPLPHSWGECRTTTQLIMQSFCFELYIEWNKKQEKHWQDENTGSRSEEEKYAVLRKNNSPRNSTPARVDTLSHNNLWNIRQYFSNSNEVFRGTFRSTRYRQK